MTTPPAETQLLQALAKMLPEKIVLRESTVDLPPVWLEWRKTFAEVKPTELLALCRMAEEGLTYKEKIRYAFDLKTCHADDLTDMKELFECVHASDFQRIQALAKVKGVVL